MWRVLDISGEGYFLHVQNKNILIEKKGQPPNRISFSDLHSIICHGQNTMLSEAFVEGCLNNGIPIVFCDEKHLPQGMLLSFFQHTDSFQRVQKQIQAKVPKKKQAWQMIIKAKILAQSKVLEIYNDKTEIILKSMADHVLSGDSSNLEAQAAKIYFEELFGEGFIRSDDDNNINIMLNYGYSIVRSSVARAVVSCGLYPSFGVFHSGRINPFCLIDDLMEPLRPIVDKKVFDLYKRQDIPELTPTVKRYLIAIATEPVRFRDTQMELSIATRRYVMEYLDFISGDSKNIHFPEMED